MNFIKKIFCAILSVMLFTSCSDTELVDVENPVLGVWNSYYPDTDSLVMVRVFTSDFYSYFSYADGKAQDQKNRQSYTINETHIMLYRYTQAYKLVDDTLWITNSKGDQTTKYIR